jgi:ADP-heptose:LPS heptosyltransferase
MNLIQQPHRDKPQSALLFPGALGDFICLLPVLQALARTAQVDVFAKTEFAEIVPRDISVRALERYEINRLFVAGGSLERRVRDFFSPYHFIYSWMGSRQAVFAGELGAAAPGKVRLFAFRTANSALHQTDYYLSCLGFCQSDCGALIIPLRPEALAWSRQFWDRHALNNRAVLVMAPGSGAREKNWPPAYFAAVAGWWRVRTGGEVVVLVGPVEEERGGFEALADGFIAARNLKLAQVAALLRRADIYLGNDSGTTHLAAALGTPTVALFGPSDARSWAPRGDKVKVLRLGAACSPCAHEVMTRCLHRHCLTGFFPEKIVNELEHFAETATLTWGGSGITVHADRIHLDKSASALKDNQSFCGGPSAV